MNKDEMNERQRDEFARMLPGVLCKAVKSYDDFISQEQSDDAIKNFNAHAAASKTALGNIAQLVKLFEQLEQRLGSDGQKEFLRDVMQQAVKEVDGYAEDINTESTDQNNDDTAH